VLAFINCVMIIGKPEEELRTELISC